MLKRTITGAVITVVTVGFFLLRQFVDERLFLILIAAISVMGAIETSRAIGPKTSIFQKIVCVAAAFLANAANFFFGLTGMLVVYAVALCVLFMQPVFCSGKTPFEALAYSMFALIYPSALIIPLTMMNNLGGISFFALVLTFIISPCADVFAYLTGMTFKGKKLCPEISPKKTISGAIGGLIGGMVGSILVYVFAKSTFTYHMGANPYVFFALVGLIAAALTELGDLVESYFKRSVNIKDSGNLFPGHGGMLDRVDGLIFASIFIYFVTALF